MSDETTQDTGSDERGKKRTEALEIARDYFTSVASLLRHDTTHCPRCGALIDHLNQIVHCVYAAPCGCRLWQGSIPKSWQTKDDQP